MRVTGNKNYQYEILNPSASAFTPILQSKGIPTPRPNGFAAKSFQVFILS